MNNRITPLSGKPTGPATFSPDEKEIVFSAENEGGKTSHIYKANIDGSGLVALTTGERYDYGPVFSPDGKEITFSSMSDGKQGDLWVMGPDGSKKRALTQGLDHDYGPIYSHDGTTIFFIRAKWFGHYSPIAPKSWHEMDIFSIKPNGTELRMVTSFNSFRIGNLSISPDNRNLVAAIKLIDASIWMLPLDNPNKKTPVKPNLEAYQSQFIFFKNKPAYNDLYAPDLSPNGTELIFSWNGFSATENVYLMDIQSAKTKKITNMKKSTYYPHFSMNGSKIIFQTTDYVTGGFFKLRAEPTIWIVNKDGTGLRAINFTMRSPTQ